MLSDVPISDMITLLEQDADVVDLSDATKLEGVNSAGIEVNSTYITNRRLNCRKNNLASPIPSVSTEADERRGFGIGSIAGTFVPFSSNFAVPYILKLTGYKDGQGVGVSQFNPDDGVDSRAINGFIAYAAVDDTIVEFTASHAL